MLLVLKTSGTRSSSSETSLLGWTLDSIRQELGPCSTVMWYVYVCMSCLNVLFVCLVCVSCMCVSSVCFVCVPRLSGCLSRSRPCFDLGVCDMF